MRGVWKFVDGHPRSASRNAGIARVETLVKMLDSESDDGDMHPLGTLNSKPSRDRASGPRNGRRLRLSEVAQVINVPPSRDDAMPEVGSWISFCRWNVEGDYLVVVPQQTTG